ncbi:spliceosome-associated protein 49 [Reticulomyxa filosa]|uniref:Spliceosome-associated protein 49 n=1 Tax=Reticulomyxa filosa TaxID=46433 RepID=X6NY56_RETFI|nr:spliceosome-associated protein 49 [Reticulomyxa filosa]|eukprot:ETO30769.1 spliceosome-associated protein 49 [Reticulomyxa filosa]
MILDGISKMGEDSEKKNDMTYVEERNQEATVWIGGLDERVDEELLWELMIQAGPVVSVNIPRDKISREHSGYAFCEFSSEDDADYAMKIMNMVRLYGKAIKINKATHDKDDSGVGANIFVGNLDPEVDDQVQFFFVPFFFFFCLKKKKKKISKKFRDKKKIVQIAIVQYVMYEEDGVTSRGFGFVNFADFDSSDQSILHMNGQFLCNRPVHVGYAYKKEGARGEKHGDETERLIAVEQAKHMTTRPHTHFATHGVNVNTNSNVNANASLNMNMNMNMNNTQLVNGINDTNLKSSSGMTSHMVTSHININSNPSMAMNMAPRVSISNTSMPSFDLLYYMYTYIFMFICL